MSDIGIAVINASTIVRDDDVMAVLPALQSQVSEHLALVWGTDATLQFVPTGTSPPAGAWWLSILDNSDQAGTLGYHDLTNEGLPLGKVFAGSTQAAGIRWTVSASHELLEMIIDPDISLAVLVQNGAGDGTLYAYEICDPCQTDNCTYMIGDVMVSDFVFPTWFESFRTQGSCQFDVTQRLTKPFELAPGGYISVYDIHSGSGWHQLNAATVSPSGAAAMTRRATVGSRRERRRLPRGQWLRSAVADS